LAPLKLLCVIAGHQALLVTHLNHDHLCTQDVVVENRWERK